jgi:hypothetical protein
VPGFFWSKAGFCVVRFGPPLAWEKGNVLFRSHAVRIRTAADRVVKNCAYGARKCCLWT